MSFVCEIKFEGRKKMVSRGSWTANSVLKQAAFWSNCCSFVSKTTRVFLRCFASKWQTPLMHRTGILFCYCWKKTMGPEIPHYEVVGFFCSWRHFFFLVDVLGNTYHRLEVMWSKPHSVGCSRGLHTVPPQLWRLFAYYAPNNFIAFYCILTYPS